jgi:3-hydroxyisobutyrate dehydrogenase-like beta-hydroxyacid dehydrogenase
MMGHRGKHMLDGLLQPPTSMIDIFVKDMDIVVDEASRLSCAVPLASHVRQQFILGKSCGCQFRALLTLKVLYVSGESTGLT